MSISLSKQQRSVADAIHMAVTSELGWSPIAATGWLSAALAETSLGIDWHTGKLNINIGGDLDPETKEPHSWGLWQVQAVEQLIQLPPRGPGIDIRKASILDQCRAVDWMLRHGATLDRKAGDALQAATTPEQAAIAFIGFERPRDHAAAIKQRVPYAESFAEMYGEAGA